MDELILLSKSPLLLGLMVAYLALRLGNTIANHLVSRIQKKKEEKLMDQKVGIEGTKSVLLLVITGVNTIKSAKADGKIDLNDLGLVLSLIPKIQPAIDGIGEVKTEISDLSMEELAELSTFVMVELKITDGSKASEIIGHSLKLIGNIVSLVKSIKA